jgi:hypothetical protein
LRHWWWDSTCWLMGCAKSHCGISRDRDREIVIAMVNRGGYP